jgi:transcriptional regulator with XRE-family HTH domain
MNSLDLVSQKSAEQANEHPADIGWRQYCEEHISALEQWKLRNNLSTGNVAVLLGLSPKTVANWLARKSAPVSTPTWKKLVLISRLPVLILTLAFAASVTKADIPTTTPTDTQIFKLLHPVLHSKKHRNNPFAIVAKNLP